MDPAAVEAAGEAQGGRCRVVELKDRGDRRWYVNSQGQTFAVIEGPVEFRMGSPPTEPDRWISDKTSTAESSFPGALPSPPRK